MKRFMHLRPSVATQLLFAVHPLFIPICNAPSLHTLLKPPVARHRLTHWDATDRRHPQGNLVRCHGKLESYDNRDTEQVCALSLSGLFLISSFPCITLCCNVLQCVAVCFSVLHLVAVCCNV